MPIPIENRPDLVRDPYSMGVINNNKSAWKAAQTRKLVEVRKHTEIQNLTERVDNLDEKLNKILYKLESVLSRDNICQS